MYEYSAHCVRVIDGDTLLLDIDLGFHITVRERVRLEGVNTPEMPTEAGFAAQRWVEGWVASNAALTVQVKRATDKYGRYVVRVLSGELCLNDELVSAGHAVKV